MGKREEECKCKDGLRCRPSGEWARTKLEFLDRYTPIALAVTHTKRRRWFLDLFAGPGRNIVRETGAEFPGSPIRSLGYVSRTKEQASFTDAVFVNAAEKDHEALLARVERVCALGESRIPRSHIDLRNADANVELVRVLRDIPVYDYVFAFVDITGIEHLPFETLRLFKKYRHASVDLYMLFPVEMTLGRKLSFDSAMTERYAESLTAFFDGDEWRAHWKERRTPAESERMKAALTKLYVEKLQTVWKHARVQHTISI
jgi:three-Cys-motif partner protein